MITTVADISLQSISFHWFRFFAGVAVKSAVLLGIALGVAFLWRNRSASSRHTVLILAVACTLLLPVANALFGDIVNSCGLVS